MELKVRRTTFPAAMRNVIAAHTAAIVAGDRPAAMKSVDAGARDALTAALARINPLRPLGGCEVLAQARLGFQYIVKVRFRGSSGNATLQYRLANVAAGAASEDCVWRIVELDDLTMRSPWQRPDDPWGADLSPPTVNRDG